MEMKLKPYPDHREVTLPWLDRIPAKWDVKRAKTIFQPIDVRSKTGLEELLTVSSSDGVRPRREGKVTMFKAASYIGHKLCWPGDLVINSLWAWAKGLGVSTYHGIVSTAYGVYRPKKEYASFANYFHPLLRSEAYDWEFKVRSKGIWISRLQLTDTAFLDMPVLLPPVEEAEQIGRFIKNYNGHVSRLIRAKQRLISLLNEQKQAIIQQALTRGLNSDAPAKYTDDQWFPLIPSEWNMVMLGRLIQRAVDGPHHSPRYLESGVPFLSARNVKADRWALDDIKYISRQDYEEFSKRVVPEKGDVLYTKGGTTGVARVVDLEFDFQVWVHIAVLKPNRSLVAPRYLAMALNSPGCYEQSQLLTRGATNQDLGLSRMKRISLPVPPSLEEQQLIMGELENRLSSINEAISRAKSEINLIREYRTRLIADVVTGKLDVRGVAVLEVDDDEAGADPNLSEDDESILNEEALVDASR